MLYCPNVPVMMARKMETSTASHLLVSLFLPSSMSSMTSKVEETCTDHYRADLESGGRQVTQCDDDGINIAFDGYTVPETCIAPMGYTRVPDCLQTRCNHATP